ncbi:hypothetical protein [Pedobacter sp. ASV28]|uniref:hypothetical protein n=1 Tax=Pedobacter sp. ASV28 TaxID=2795123 RepID=UPI0018EC8964|nr:hypothetical protein [Pedobacter sp. ASV28]
MVKNIVYISIAVFLMGCFSYKTENNAIRIPVSRFSIKPNTNELAYQLIDTSAIYFNTRINGQETIKDSSGNDILLREKNNAIKFYKDGRIGMFEQVDLENIKSLVPTRGRMGIYNLSNKGFLVEFVYHSPQAGIFRGKDTIRVKGDTIFRFDKKYEYEYIKLRLSKKNLIFTPDW